jgi:putative restriction endonuclease
MANRFELAHQAWPILTKAAAERRILNYLDLARALGYKGGKVAKFPLWPIQDFCLEKNLPPLTSIVVSKQYGVPSSGFIAWEGDIGDAQERVFEYDWSKIQSPFPPSIRLPPANTGSKLKNKEVSYEVADVETIVNGRGPYQAAFRIELMRLYGRQCALCDTRHPKLLVASHIVPWSQDSKNRLNPQNGILFCLTHDAAFEAGILYVLPDLTVELAGFAMKDLGTDLAGFLRTHTADRLRTPSGRTAPDPKFLAWRLDKSKAMQKSILK